MCANMSYIMLSYLANVTDRATAFQQGNSSLTDLLKMFCENPLYWGRPHVGMLGNIAFVLGTFSLPLVFRIKAGTRFNSNVQANDKMNVDFLHHIGLRRNLKLR